MGFPVVLPFVKIEPGPLCDGSELGKKMKNGTIILMVNFSEKWPPPQETIIFQNPLEKSDAILCVDTQGRLIFTVSNVTFVSQPIEFIKAHRAIISIAWDIYKYPAISLSVNSIDLYDSSTTTSLRVESNGKSIEGPISFSRPDALNACSEWIEWRKQRYSNPKLIPKIYRELKSIDSQVEELSESIQSLKYFWAAFSNKHNLFIANSLPHLRALLFWPDGKSKNYNPLLFRISGYIGIALPVFAFKYRIKDAINDDILKKAIFHMVFNPPVLVKEYPNQKLMDFQGWLNMEIISDRAAGEHKVYRWKDLIFDAANTISASHYDDDIPKFIKRLRDAKSMGGQQLLNYISAVASATIAFGDLVISEYYERKR